MTDLLLTNIGELCRMSDKPGPQAGATQGDTGSVKNAALAIENGQVIAAGPREEVEGAHGNRAKQILDARGRTVLPGWVDAHTHLLFAGTREDEFALRIQGRTYQEIAAAGGGIHASVRHFRETSDGAILLRARHNLALALQHGTTTIEIKSGYGLSTDDELRALRLIRTLRDTEAIDIIPTFLGAHEIPMEWQHDRAGYVKLVCETMIPAVAREGLAVFCDVFCEEGVFTPEESRTILNAARAHGLQLKLHADEFGDTGGSRLAAELHAVSADHLHGTPPDVARAMAHAGTIGVLLPGTSFFLNMRDKAPARGMIDVGLPVAVASDFNPGSCMSQSMPMMATLACVQLRLTPEEALVACSANGAAALALGDRVGRLRPGYRADLQVLDLPAARQLPYHFGVSHVRAVFRGGRQVLGAPLD